MPRPNIEILALTYARYLKYVGMEEVPLPSPLPLATTLYMLGRRSPKVLDCTVVGIGLAGKEK